MGIGRATLAALAAAALCSPAAAAPLDKEACDKLKAEHATMGIVKDHIAKGPEWGKSHLSKDQLKDVERYIQMEEQIAFRCVERKPPPEVARAKVKPKARKAAEQPEETTADGAAKPAGGAKTAKAAAVPKPAAKAQPSANGKPVSESIASKTASPTAPVKKPPPKPKANDAYVPPSGQSTVSQ
jgi:hypothetical protein